MGVDNSKTDMMALWPRRRPPNAIKPGSSLLRLHWSHWLRSSCPWSQAERWFGHSRLWPDGERRSRSFCAAIFWQRPPPGPSGFCTCPGKLKVFDSRSRLLFYCLVVALTVLIAIWIFDQNNRFRSEQSNLTYFSAVALTLACIASALNVKLAIARAGSVIERVFWAILSLGFLIASVDEYFEGHETVSSAVEPWFAGLGVGGEIVQDGSTALYAVAAVALGLIFHRYFRAELLKSGMLTGWLLIVGV